MSVLLGLSPAARAQSGSYGAPTYGGTCKGTSTGTYPYTDTLYITSSSASMNAPLGNPGTLSVSGTCTANFAWPTTGNPGPVPQQVIVAQTCSIGFNNQGEPPASGTCSDGQGDSPVPGSGTSGTQGWTYNSCSSGGTHYAMQTGSQTVTATCSPSLSLGGGTQGGGGGVLSYTAAIYPITISPGGATSDGNGGWDIAVGQHCSPSLSGIPAGCTVSNYTWTVSDSGTTFQAWSNTTPAGHSSTGASTPGSPANPNGSYYAQGPGPLNGPNPNSNPAIPAPQWYWNDANTTLETITCSATVTPPAGDGAAFTVMAMQKVNVMVPTVNVIGAGGVGRINNTNAALENKKAGYWLYAGSTTAGYMDAGDTWAGTVTENAPISGGQWAFVQIITPSAKNGSVVVDANTGLTGLDGVFPYSGPYNADGTQEAEGDSPGEPLLDSYANMTIADAFQVYVMYLPKGGNWVAVAYMKWNFDANDTRPSSGHWADYTPPDAAGTVTPGSGTFKPQSTFPTWTRISK